MKKYLFFIGALIALGLGSASATYQQQGFSQYQENGSGISFRCQSSCVILLGDLGSNDQLLVNGGTHQGDGTWGYGYLVGPNIYSATLLPARGYQRTFADDPVHGQLPDGKRQIVFLVNGPLKADNIHITMNERGASELLGWAWNRFRKVESLAPYSINLHYGPMIGTWSWPIFGLVIMLLAILIAYVFHKKLSLKKGVHAAIVALIAVTLIGGVKLLIDDLMITQENVSSFSVDHHDVFDVGDYIAVTEKVRDFLHLDNLRERQGKSCTIYAKSYRSRPVDAHRNSVYLRPCTPVETGSMADYQLYYNTPADASATGTIVLTGNNFTLFNARP